MMKLILFVLLAVPMIALAQGSSPAPDSGVQGVILIGPVMGGPTRQGAPDTKPLPDTEFVVKQGDRVVTSFRTDKDGHFKVSLGPGHFTVMRKERAAAMGFYGPFAVEVGKGKMENVQWKCDSGMR